VTPHAPWSHRLKNGALAVNPTRARRCGARTRASTACRQPAMSNSRCRLHDGFSTGARSAEGLARVRAAITSSGRHTENARTFRRLIAGLEAQARLTIAIVGARRQRPEIALQYPAGPRAVPHKPSRAIVRVSTVVSS
jgi:hypothetical protein